MMTTATELQFADDAALLGFSREQIERVVQVLDEVATKWGLTFSIPKTKLLVAGRCNEEDMQPIVINEAPIEVVSVRIQILGFSDGGTRGDPERCREQDCRASIAFGKLCRPVLQDSSLSMKTNRMVYHAVVLGVLLYGAEVWVTKRAAIRKLESFNNRCLRRVLGITKPQHHIGHITSAEIRRRFGMQDTLF